MRTSLTAALNERAGLSAGQDIGEQQVDAFEWDKHVQKAQNSLRVLSEQTGGIAVVNTNDFDKALKRIDAETSDYYVLGYYSKNPDPTMRRRVIDIKVKRKNGDVEALDVMFRREYTLRSVADVRPAGR